MCGREHDRYDLAGNVASEEWANGRTLTHSYDELDRRTASVDELGVAGAWDYDDDGHLLAETDGGGHQTTFEVNALGHRTEARAPLGRTRTFVVGIHGELLSDTSPLGKVTTHRYDSRGQRIGTTLPSDANAQALVWTYDGLGKVLTASDGNGEVTTHTYDPRGRKESTAISADDGGVAETFDYDDQDDLVTHTDRRGIAHAYRYDHEHRATRYQRAGVTQWTREHDAVGNVLAETDANGHTTTSTYDAANQRISATRGGKTRSWTYTPTNQVETQTDAAGAVTHNEYNERDQLLESTNGANETTTFTVDGDGLQRTRELAGAVWTNTFDAAHRLTGVESPEAHETIYGYNADDALTAITDAEGRVTTQAVDSQGRITSRSYPGGATFATTFDGNGNAVSDTTPEHSTTRSFDALNRLRSETAASITRMQSFDGNGNRLTASLGSDTVRTQTYDPHNRPLADTLATPGSSYTLTATRDANGNRTLSRDARNVATTNTFDAHNRLIGSSAAEGATTNTWNADGTLARITQANGVETVYAYDGAKRITSITHRKNGIATLSFGYDYDGRGNRVEETRIEAALPGQAARTITTTHAYDRDDRLVQSSITHQPANAQTPDTRTEWTLDAVGNRQTETVTELGTNTLRSDKTYTYNDRDQLERITDPTNDLQIDYAYDGNGNRTRREVRSANVLTSQVTYTFDARDRLIQAQPNAPNEAIVQYHYDADDRRIARIEIPRVNGTPQPPIVTEYVFDNSNLLHEASATAITATYRGSAVVDRHIDHATNTVRHYQLDALRTPVAMTDAAGNTINATTFDAWGNPTQQTASGTSTVPWQVPNYNPLTTGQAALLANDGQSIGFTGYGKDSTTGLYYANARWYDPLVGSFNAMDPAWGAATKPVTFHKYLYANGNPTVYVDRDGRCGVAAYIGLNYGTCDFADAVLLGVNQNSFEGKIAIERYRQAQAKEILRQGADAVLAGAKLFGDFAVSGRESLTGEDLGAGDEIGAAIQGTLDYFGNLPVNVINGLAELNAEMGAAREQQDPERMARATAPVAITVVTAFAPAARGLAGVGRAATPNLPDIGSHRSLGAIDDHVPSVAPDTSVAARTEVVVEPRGSTYTERFNQTPRNGGWWSGERAESTFYSRDPDVQSITRDQGVAYSDARPNFAPYSAADVEISGMTGDRLQNFRKADQEMADRLGVSKREIKRWREENNFTWHEDTTTKMQLVPTKVNEKYKHLGGVGEVKRQ